MKKLGLVGGISWVSTIDYYRFINQGINEKLGGLHFAECLIYSLNFDDFQRNNSNHDWEATFRLLLEACKSLQAGGAEALVLCANTAHVVAEKLEKNMALPLIHIVDATGEAIQKKGVTKVGLLGTKFTMEMDFYIHKLRAHHIHTLIPASGETRDYLQHTIKEELGRGIIRQETKKAYLAIIDELIKEGAEGIILGCTEIPLLIHPEDVPVPVFNTTEIHAAAAVAFALSPRSGEAH